MAAHEAILSCRSLLVSLRNTRAVSVVFSRVQRPTTCVMPLRLFHASEVSNKGDKFNLSNQGKKRRRFRSEKSQDDMVSSKVETFKLDPSEEDYEQRSTTSSNRRDALAVTLQQAMTSLLESNDVDQELTSLDIEITNVKIAHDMGHVVFYWITDKKDSSYQRQVAELLQRNENTLRLLLPSYHLLNVSPRVVFSHDKHLDHLANINALLNASTQESQDKS